MSSYLMRYLRPRRIFILFALATLCTNLAEATLINISTNGFVGPAGLRAGFIISGDSPKRIIVLGERFNSNIDATLKVTDLSGTVIIKQNDNWRDDDTASEVATTLGRTPNDDSDAAFAITLAPGTYIAILEDKNSLFGTGIVAINDLNNDGNLTELINISTNGEVTDVGLRAGFIITGNNAKRIIVLGERFNSTIDPRLTVTDLSGTVVLGTNDNWQDDPTASEVMTVLNRSPGDELDAAFALTLEPGVYIASLLSGNNIFGPGIVAINDFSTLTTPTTPACVDISGNWTGSEDVTISCRSVNGTSMESQSGAGPVIISQQGCAIDYQVPGFNVMRQGVINGNQINVSGPIVISLLGEVNLTENSATLTGTVNNDEISLTGSGTAAGTIAGVDFSCSANSRAELTRLAPGTPLGDCIDSAGFYTGDFNETYCDGERYSGLLAIAIQANCSVQVSTGEGTVISSRVENNQIQINFDDEECGTLRGTGTLNGTTISGTYSYSAGGGGSFSVQKQ